MSILTYQLELVLSVWNTHCQNLSHYKLCVQKRFAKELIITQSLGTRLSCTRIFEFTISHLIKHMVIRALTQSLIVFARVDTERPFPILTLVYFQTIIWTNRFGHQFVVYVVTFNCIIGTLFFSISIFFLLKSSFLVCSSILISFFKSKCMDKRNKKDRQNM